MTNLSASPKGPVARDWPLRFTKGLLIWIAPVAILWIVLTPIYNRFLTKAAENLVRLTESPAATRLQLSETHFFLITRNDVPMPRGYLSKVPVTDTHFPLIMLGAFFLAVPGVAMKKRLEPLGWSVLIAVCFHILALFLWVKFTYATQLGEWSMNNYGAFARNFWGISKHLADLPFKFGLPVLLWSFFFLGEILPKKPARN
jgi:hypothetical protein